MVQVLLACLNAISSKILGVKYFISILLVLSVFAPTHAQTDSLLVSDTAFHWLTLVREHPQKSFSPDIPPGNFSGITPLGDGLYAVVDDKKGDGFYVFKLRFDKRGSVTSAYNIGFYTSGLVNRDAEDIVYMPSSKTFFISGEVNNDVLEYSLVGQRTIRELKVPEVFRKAHANQGLEPLAYNESTHLFWTTSESTLKGDSLHRLQSFGEDMQPREQFPYQMDKPISTDYRERTHGVSAMTALDDGSLLVLEREAFTSHNKIGSWVNCKLYQVFPQRSLEKHLIHEWKTKMTLLQQNFANYEGMCLGPVLKDGSQVILLVSDSQNQYYGILRDWFKTLVVK